MNEKTYWSEPTDVGQAESPFRSIKTPIPFAEDIATTQMLRESEPRSMSGQPPIVWERAVGRSIYDRAGNKWLDFSSGVVVAAAGHSHPAILKAIREAVDAELLHTYCFPNPQRAKLVAKFKEVLPDTLDKVFLLTTGSEATEAAIKVSRSYAQKIAGRSKNVVVTFEGAFHGRTMGAQMAGGVPALKEWIVNHDPDMIQVPFPGNFRTENKSFEGFLTRLEEKGVAPENIAMVMTETYQGGTVAMLPIEFAVKLRKFCDENKICLTMDEVQAGFGRTGKRFGFQHYGIVPDLACFGKGVSSSLPLSALAGRSEIMDVVDPNRMTSTHTGNPVCSAAAHANICAILEEGMVENSAKVGEVLKKELEKLKSYECVGHISSVGLVAAIQFVKPGTTEPDGDLAWKINRRCIEKGLMLFSPVGPQGSSIKIAPPLSMTVDEVIDGVSVICDAFREIVG